MHLSTFGAFASLLALGYADCNHNNCLRAVLGISFPTRSGLADCMSYLQATVTPATSTFTVTQTATITTPTTSTETDLYTISVPVTVTKTDSLVVATVTETYTQTDFSGGVKRGLKERQVTAVPTNIPQYALGPCSVAASYAYACSCVGATASTITVPAPSTTITVSATSTAATLEVQTLEETVTDTYSVTATTFATLTKTVAAYQTTTVCSPDPTGFYLRASDGQYLQYADTPDDNGVGRLYPVDSIGSATVFAIDASLNVYLPGLTGPAGGVLYLAGSGALNEATSVFAIEENVKGYTKLPWVFNPTTLQLTCNWNGQSVFNWDGQLLLGTTAFGAGVELFADCS